MIKICLIRYWNHLIKLDNSWLMRKILHTATGRAMSYQLHMEEIPIIGETFDLDYVKEKLLILVRKKWSYKIP